MRITFTWLWRLLFLVAVLIGANFGGFAYAYLARSTAGNPFFGNQTDTNALFPAYFAYIEQIAGARFTDVAVYGDDFTQVLIAATVASLGLLASALFVSIVLGIGIGLLGVRMRPPGVRGWLTAVTTVGLSTPSFFFGRLTVAIFFLMIINLPGATMPLPIQGYGWDEHLILPVIALALRPTAQIGQIMAGLLAGELGRQYVVAARGRGLSEGRVVRRHALRNVWAPIFQTMAGTVRLLVGELIVVEWLFAWPGLGALMAATLIPAGFSSASVESRFLDPPLVASILTIFAFVFVVTDMLAGQLARLFDPRQRVTR
jgi:peptide/nickel transport system permease protein